LPSIQERKEHSSRHNITMTKVPFYIHDFLNAVPVIYPVYEQKIDTALELRLSDPSRIADVSREGSTFSGVIPSVAAMNRNDLIIIDSFCIASKGQVKTVCFYSEKPLEEVRSVILDGRSRTSHLMLKLIFSLKGIKLPTFIIDTVNQDAIQSGISDGFLIIGDDNIVYEKELSALIKYDLGELWFSLTGKKFVHAITVTNNLNEVDTLKNALKTCLEYSFGHFDDLIRYASKRYGLNERFCTEYLKNIILYEFDKESEEGLKTFHQFSKKIIL